jgi:hypothetical protein
MNTETRVGVMIAQRICVELAARGLRAHAEPSQYGDDSVFHVDDLESFSSGTFSFSHNDASQAHVDIASWPYDGSTQTWKRLCDYSLRTREREIAGFDVILRQVSNAAT